MMTANSAYELLEYAYDKLDFSQGDLVSSKVSLSEITLEEWIEKGDWLELAKQVEAEKVFFVNNNPVIIFAKCDTQEDEKVRQIFNKIWCMARPSYLFLAKEGELAIYDLTKPPARSIEDWKKNNRPLEVAQNILEVTSKLYQYRREQIESGKLFEDERFETSNQRADQSLIKDLKTVRLALISGGLSENKRKYAHALIGRSIFICYLEDRGILTQEYFEAIAQNNATWKALLNAPDDQLNMETEAKQHYIKILSDKSFTYAFFNQLSQDFNGDMFPSDEQEAESVEQRHLSLLQEFLQGNIDPQKKLFFWAYKFDIIPISLISSIYEEFYHESNTENIDNGTHYTPSSLVEFVLSKVLTSDCLTTHPRILDPCCGSGIFLVEAFRRIVRHRVYQNQEQRLSWQELREILKNQIAGIEINSEAIRITAFSLYLALLNYQEPRNILSQIKRGEKLPFLIYQANGLSEDNHFNNLVCDNAFQEFSNSEDLILSRNFSSQCADVVVGNPPWGSPKTKDKKGTKDLNIALQWCQERDYPVGDKERSQAFIWRVFDFLKDNGWSALVVSTGILFKTHDKSKEFRQKWLNSVLLKEVVNFAHVRDIFFKSGNKNQSSASISPFASIIFQKVNQTELTLKDQVVTYWSAKKTAMIKNVQAVILSVMDRRGIRQSELFYNDSLWKIYYWGNHQDAGLIQGITLAPALKELHDPNNSGQGFTTGSAYSAPQWLSEYQNLPIPKFQRYSSIQKDWFTSSPKKVHRIANESLFYGERLLIKHGISQASRKKGEIIARLESENFSFTNSVNCIKLHDAEEWKYKIILGTLWSSLSRYYFFLTSSKWGIWHDGIYKDEYLSLPIIFPKDQGIREKVIDIVEQLQNCNPIKYSIEHPEGKTPEKIEAQLTELEYQLDEAIFDVYDLTIAERDLIRDMCDVGIEFYYNHINSKAVKPVESYPQQNQGLLNDINKNRQTQKGLEGYLQAFLDIWNRELEPDGEFSWQIIRPQFQGLENPMLAVIFSTQEYGEKPQPVSQSDQKQWIGIIAQLARQENGLLVPYNSHQIYLDGLVRSVSDTEIIIIKRNERRFWTRSMAREDAEATMLQIINLQESQERI